MTIDRATADCYQPRLSVEPFYVAHQERIQRLARTQVNRRIALTVQQHRVGSDDQATGGDRGVHQTHE